MGREPSHDPDVFVDIPQVKVDEIYLDVEDLEAHLALRAKLANLVQLVAGVHIHIGKVELDIKGVEAEALLKVRLENLYDILDRALTTLDRNPEILESLVETVDDTVGNIGAIGERALGPGGAVSGAVESVGDTAEKAVEPGGAVSEVADQVGQTAQQATGPGGAVTEAADQVGQTAQQATGPGGAVSEAAGQVGQTAQGATGAAGEAAGAAGQGAGQATRGGRTRKQPTAARRRGTRRGKAKAKSPKKAGAEQPNRADLYQEAKRRDIRGRSKMTKKQLQSALAKEG